MNEIRIETLTLSEDFSQKSEKSLGDPGRDFEPGGPFVVFSGAWDWGWGGHLSPIPPCTDKISKAVADKISEAGQQRLSK